MTIWSLLFIIFTSFHFSAITATSNTVTHHPQTKAKVLPAAFLSPSYYQETCPNLELIIHNILKAWVKKDYTLAPSIIRLHFHDCVIRGCDASLLLYHTGSERSAGVSKTLRGFQVIDEIKAEVEKQCPKTVSCADILTASAREATVLAGGPFWEVPFGRKDGRVSIAGEAERVVPQGHENITALIDIFGKMGLTPVDLVVLSGAHTIGRSTCRSVDQRLFNGKSVPAMDPGYLGSLRRQCGSAGNFVNLDITTPRVFDVAYYENLGRKMGLLSTDQLLFSDERTAGLVGLMAAQPEIFTGQFAVSMINLGNVNVLTGKQGEVRLNCNFVNQ